MARHIASEPVHRGQGRKLHPGCHIPERHGEPLLGADRRTKVCMLAPDLVLYFRQEEVKALLWEPEVLYVPRWLVEAHLLYQIIVLPEELPPPVQL